ncbi:MAG TPA: hypothetical protein VF594_06175 [Rubricoccaceae bacterium]
MLSRTLVVCALAALLAGCATASWYPTYARPHDLAALRPFALRVTLRDGTSRVLLGPDIRADSVVGRSDNGDDRVAIASADIVGYEVQRNGGPEANPSAPSWTVVLGAVGFGLFLVSVMRVLSGFDGS